MFALEAKGGITCSPGPGPSAAPFDLKIEVCLEESVRVHGERETYQRACTTGDNLLTPYTAEASAIHDCPPGSTMRARTWALAEGYHGNYGYSKVKRTGWFIYNCPEPPVHSPIVDELLEVIFPGSAVETDAMSATVEESLVDTVDGATDSVCGMVSGVSAPVGSLVGDLVVFC